MSQSLLKRVTTSGFAARIASFFISLYIRLVMATTRWERVGRIHADPFIKEHRGFIVAFWHQRLLMSPLFKKETDQRVFMLISAHRDGEIIANAVKGLGIEFIRGSAADPRKKFKEKGGAGAVADMTAVLQRGDIVGMTPDGPRGPARKAQAGVVRLAQLSGAPIVPIAYSTSRGKFAGTWDRFLLAAPFSRGCIAAGEPITVAADAAPHDIESARLRLEAALNAVCEIADARVGRSPDRSDLH
jgi:lysophospholipid acyltransferase (LPLAT)-like uncharacterized protein